MRPSLVGNNKVPGGPRDYPIVGVMFDFPRDRRNFLTNVFLQYDDVAKYSIANIKFYEVLHLAGVKHVLKANANNYSRGKKFDPLRFTPEHSNRRHEYAYFPFGLGPHHCIGMDLAVLPAPLVLLTVTQRLRLELLPEAKVEIVFGPMLRPSQLLVRAKLVS